ncbi:MAG: protease SohB [Halieaceae bacterium]|nr:protease SohB [Halieaceae bacterium]
MEFLYEYGLFLAKAITLVAAVLAIVAAIVSMRQHPRGRPDGHMEVRKLNDRYGNFRQFMQSQMLPPKEFKALRKEDKQKAKKQQGEQSEQRRRLYVLGFDGDLKASATEDLREEVSTVISVAGEGDEVLLRLESGGGMVHSYGLAASQLQRIRDAGIPLTVAVDRFAASGGYMMACVGERILAAPFAVIGSIGVLAQLPNFHRLLQKANIDFEQLSAGEHKRSVTMFGKNNAEDRAKLQQDLEDTHQLFKEFVTRHRQQVAIDEVSTGEVWYGQRALDQGLVDELKTSDSYIQESLMERDVFEVKYVLKRSWQEKLGLAASGAVERALLKILQGATREQKH